MDFECCFTKVAFIMKVTRTKTNTSVGTLPEHSSTVCLASFYVPNNRRDKSTTRTINLCPLHYCYL